MYIGSNCNLSVPLIYLHCIVPYDFTTKTLSLDMTLPQLPWRLFTNFDKYFFMWSSNIFVWSLQGSGNLTLLLFSISDGEDLHSFVAGDFLICRRIFPLLHRVSWEFWIWSNNTSVGCPFLLLIIEPGFLPAFDGLEPFRVKCSKRISGVNRALYSLEYKLIEGSNKCYVVRSL